VGLLDLAVLNDQSVALAAVVAEDGSGIEVEVESLGELAVRVGKEADLKTESQYDWMSSSKIINLRRSSCQRQDREPMPSCYIIC